jgi:hypothetical protein
MGILPYILYCDDFAPPNYQLTRFCNLIMECNIVRPLTVTPLSSHVHVHLKQY